MRLTCSQVFVPWSPRATPHWLRSRCWRCFLIQVAWLLTVPPYMGIDEIDHTYRASSIGVGELRPLGTFSNVTQGRGDKVAVRSDVVTAAHDACRLLPYYGKGNCTPVGPGQRPGTVVVASSAARYNPAFYATIGIVARPFTGYAYLYALRVAAGLLCTILFAAAVWSVLTFARTVALLFIGTTPITLNHRGRAERRGDGQRAPSACLLVVPSDAPRPWLQVVATVSATATVHTLGRPRLALITHGARAGTPDPRCAPAAEAPAGSRWPWPRWWGWPPWHQRPGSYQPPRRRVCNSSDSPT